MKHDYQNEYLGCAMTIGELLLENGGEVYRVEDAIQRIMLSAGATDTSVFCITSCIIVTTRWSDGYCNTETRRIKHTSNDLGLLDHVNDLSRRLCHQHYLPETIRANVDDLLKHEKKYSSALQYLSYGIVSAAFTLLFGGDYYDAFAALLIGLLIKKIETLTNSGQFNQFFSLLIISLAGGTVSAFLVYLGVGRHADLISLGNIMLLIPGLMFTNSIRDIFLGDTITGMIRLFESLLYAMTIAVGFSIGHCAF